MRIPTLVICSLFVLGCGGDDGGGGDTPDATIASGPKIASTTPMANATDVGIDVSVTVSFAGAIDPATLNATNFTLEDGDGNAVGATVTPQAMAATLVPDAPLLGGVTYTARLSTAVTDQLGTPLDSEYSWSFTIRPVAWRSPQMIESDDSGNAQVSGIATDAAGNMIATWRVHDGTRYNAWAAVFTIGSGWSQPMLLEDNDLGHAYSVKVAMDPAGFGMAFWVVTDGQYRNLWARRYDPAAGWEDAMLVESRTGDVRTVSVGVDASGTFIAAWTQDGGSFYTAWASRRPREQLYWDPSEALETSDEDVKDIRLAVNADGTAFAVWAQDDTTRNNIVANHYDPQSGWGTAQPVETETGDALSPAVAVDSAGNATVAWRQYDAGTMLYNIWTNRYTAGSSWGSGAGIETSVAGDAGRPELTAGSDGSVVVVWNESDGGNESIWANRYTPGTGWATAGVLENDDAGYAQRARVALDPQGNAIVVWYQGADNIYNIYASYGSAAGDWSAPVVVGVEDQGLAADPELAIDPFGRANVVWFENDGTRDNIWAARFD